MPADEQAVAGKAGQRSGPSAEGLRARSEYRRMHPHLPPTRNPCEFGPSNEKKFEVGQTKPARCRFNRRSRARLPASCEFFLDMAKEGGHQFRPIGDSDFRFLRIDKRAVARPGHTRKPAPSEFTASRLARSSGLSDCGSGRVRCVVSWRGALRIRVNIHPAPVPFRSTQNNANAKLGIRSKGLHRPGPGSRLDGGMKRRVAWTPGSPVARSSILMGEQTCLDRITPLPHLDGLSRRGKSGTVAQ
jgi:hypothetical protein